MHITQYFEMFGHRSLYHDGWRAVCPWPGTSFTESGLSFGAPIDAKKLTELDAKGWELYNLEKDFAETNNLAEKERDRLIEMIGMWYVEAGKYNVLPIDSRGTRAFADERPQIAVERKSTRTIRARRWCPPMRRRSCSTGRTRSRCTSTFPKGGAEGVLFSGGDDRRLRVLRAGRQAALRLQLRRRPVLQRPVEGQGSRGRHIFASSSRRPASPTSPRARCAGKAQLFVDGKLVGKAICR